MKTPPPTLGRELELIRSGCGRIAGMDEVGRGALAGPVLVGVVVVDDSVGEPPTGLRDSKLLSARWREQLVPLLHNWCRAAGIGTSSAAEIDAVGIMGALRLAGLRALSDVGNVDHVLLDGNHDWLSPTVSGQPVPELQRDQTPEVRRRTDPTRSGSRVPDQMPPPVTTVIGGDRSAATMAAASVLAKVARDQMMTDLADEFPQYHWQRNKGYGTAQHLAAIRQHGATESHRMTWRLPGHSPIP